LSIVNIVDIGGPLIAAKMALKGMPVRVGSRYSPTVRTVQVPGRIGPRLTFNSTARLTSPNPYFAGLGIAAALNLTLFPQWTELLTNFQKWVKYLAGGN
jgi:hypothetical protein